ncbi:Probable calcium-binding protein CML29 [Linum grandiflorum]
MARAQQLSSETERLNQVVTLVEAFKAFDSDNDGFITAAELGGILGSLGYSAAGEQDVRAMMLQGDKDRDGLLSVGEFLEMNTKDMEVANKFSQKGGCVGSLLKAAMEALDDEDEDETTLVTGEELWEFLADSGQRQMSLEDCQAIVAAMDVDGDGAISSQDLKLIATSLL